MLTIPAMRPLLPSSERLLPYLQRIDSGRIYSNHGPLVLELEARLAAHFGLTTGAVASANSGTNALIGAILATAGRANAARPYALMPSCTFVATAHAAEQCGYRPYLVDVDPETLLLQPGRLIECAALDSVGVIIPVAAFGRPVPQAPWQKVQARTGIPVVIDGAASFETVSQQPERYLGAVPTVLSFHATKSFATGEGGCCVGTDVELLERTVKALNFGFHESRVSGCASTNGKMSEYHAAVGLAELDGWDAKRLALGRVIESYRSHLSERGFADRFLGAPEIASSYVLFRCRDLSESSHVQDRLRQNHIEFRHWYGEGLRKQTHFSNSLHDDLSVAESVLPRLIGLPMAPDLDDAVIARTVSAVAHGLEEQHVQRCG